ncbi:MAG: hypothetical protein JXA10_15470 [Anaerolineae bacterium]|nr:hypothetical protein [Anaerolineae bacterium]
MNLSDVWNSVEYTRNDDDEIIAVQVPIEMWRFLMDHVQKMEDKQAARDRLAKLRKSQSANKVTED